MTPEQAESFLEKFFNSSPLQQKMVEGIDLACQLSDAIAETHGFHEDEKELDRIFNQLELDMLDGYSPRSLDKLASLRQWVSDQLLQAEQARVMSETAEGVENVRKGRGPDDKLPEYPGWVVEAVDDIIRNFDMLGKRGWMPGAVLLAKARMNNGRPYKHGKNS